MNIFEVSWFIVSLLILAIIMFVDPKNSITGSNTNMLSGLFASPNSGQQFIYKLSSILIAFFFILTIVLSLIA
jgi:protein translocase SecG subunit